MICPRCKRVIPENERVCYRRCEDCYVQGCVEAGTARMRFSGHVQGMPASESRKVKKLKVPGNAEWAQAFKEGVYVD